jgi:hypothetical protein
MTRTDSTGRKWSSTRVVGIGVAAAAVCLLAWPAHAKNEFEDAFKYELGRIAAHEAVHVGKQILGVVIFGSPPHSHYPYPDDVYRHHDKYRHKHHRKHYKRHYKHQHHGAPYPHGHHNHAGCCSCADHYGHKGYAARSVRYDR